MARDPSYQGHSRKGGIEIVSRVHVLAGKEKLALMLKAAPIVSLLVFLVGTNMAPDRAWPNLLIAAIYVTSLALAGVFFIALNYLARASWPVVLRRIPEAYASSLVWGAALIAGVIAGAHSLYEWTDPRVVHADPLLAAKAPWLNLPAFAARSALYFAIWIGFAAFIVGHSRRQDMDGDARHTFANIRASGAFLFIFAITYSFASFDWIMSLEPLWYSTIFGIYNFCGLFLSGLAAIAVGAIVLRRLDILPGVAGEEQYHDLGKLIFGFSSFWAYIWFCQYMLIWYTDFPEEAVYFANRFRGGWGAFFVMNLVVNWVIPFVFLLPAAQKRNETVLFRVSMLILIGRWVDIYLMVMPVFQPSPAIGVWEIGIFLGGISLFLATTFRSLSRAKIIPVNDPLLRESLDRH